MVVISPIFVYLLEIKIFRSCKRLQWRSELSTTSMRWLFRWPVALETSQYLQYFLQSKHQLHKARYKAESEKYFVGGGVPGWYDCLRPVQGNLNLFLPTNYLHLFKCGSVAKICKYALYESCEGLFCNSMNEIKSIVWVPEIIGILPA